MRIVSYNILDGGEGRADPLGEVIEAQRPDVVGLVEADDEAVVRRIARRLGMDWILAAGNAHALAILSRYPVIETINYAPWQPELSRGLLVAQLQVGEAMVQVAVTHLHPYAAEPDEDRRMGELEVILPLLGGGRRTKRGHPEYSGERLSSAVESEGNILDVPFLFAGVQVLMGDFNSNSPVQRIDPEKCKPSTRQAWEANGGRIPRRVIQKVLEEGFVDALEMCDLRAAQTAGTFSTQFPGQRVDYIFLRGIDHAQIHSAWIEQDRLAKYASDHFPVGAQIDL